MSPINRFSSRRQRLDHASLSAKLKGAQSYKRIAGYFRSLSIRKSLQAQFGQPAG